MYSLEDVIRFTGLSRSRIDKYENAGVVKKPQGKGTHSQTLYDDEGLKQLFMCRLYHELGYNIPDICRLKDITVLDGNNYPIIKEKKELRDTIEKLKERKRDIERLITIAEFIDEGELDLSIIFDLYSFADIEESLSYEQIISITKTMIESYDSFIFQDSKKELLVQQDDVVQENNESNDLLFTLLDILTENNSNSTFDINNNLQTAFEYYKEYIHDSLETFKAIIILVFRSNDIIEMIEKEHGKEYYEMIMQTFEVFFKNTEHTKSELQYFQSLNDIAILATQKYTTGSLEVQKIVNDINVFFMSNKMFSCEENYMQFKRLSWIYGSKEMSEILEGGKRRGICWFISKAIDCFCLNLEKSKKT